MGNVVKNTTKIGLFDLLCPYSCRGCGQLGDVLCGCCKDYIIRESKPICPLCKKTLACSRDDDVVMKCDECEISLDGVFVGGWREGALAKVIKDFKYSSVRAAGEILAEILDHAIPRVSELDKVVVVPLPTIGRHVRARGMDHTRILAKKLAARRDWEVARILRRKTDTVQVGADMKKRQEQAARTYEIGRDIDAEATYLLLDDIWTTGASVLAAAKVMKAVGAKSVYAAVVATGREREQH